MFGIYLYINLVIYIVRILKNSESQKKQEKIVYKNVDCDLFINYKQFKFLLDKIKCLRLASFNVNFNYLLLNK